MERALGEVPNVEDVYFDWRVPVAWVRFASGKTADADSLAGAITEKTPFSGGLVTFIREPEGLPDELR